MRVGIRFRHEVATGCFPRGKVRKMKSSNRFLIVLVTAVLLLCCWPTSAQDIRYNFVPGTDFSKYRTYKWVRVPKVEYPNQIMDGKIMREIDAKLGRTGLT